MELGSLVGRTLIGYFESAEKARFCVYELRRAGFGEDQVGFARGPVAAVVTVLPGERGEAAGLILRRRSHAGGSRVWGLSAVRDAIDRVRRRS